MNPQTLLSPIVAVVLSGTAATALAQPDVTGPAPDKNIWRLPPLSLPELEKLIDGRAKLTLDLKGATLAESAKAINSSTGLNLTLYEARTMPMGAAFVQPTYTFEAKGEPFWEAFLAWQRAAFAARKEEPNLAPPARINGRAVQSPPPPGLFRIQKTGSTTWLQPGQPLALGRTLVKWPYVMVGTQLTRTQQSTLSETGLLPVGMSLPVPPGEQAEVDRWLDGLLLDTRVYLDPKIEPIKLRCEVEEAIDDKGNDLRVGDRVMPDSPNSRSFQTNMNGGRVVSIPLGSRPGMGKKLVRLRGSLRFWVVTRTQHWETTDLTTPIAGSIVRDGGGFNVRFNGVTQTPGGWDVGFSARSEGEHLQRFWDERLRGVNRQVGDLEDNRIFSSTDFRVQLVDAAGNALTRSGGGSSSTLGRTNAPQTNGLAPGDSPLPVDIELWKYTEDSTIHFGQPSNRPVLLGDGMATGAPTEKVFLTPIVPPGQPNGATFIREATASPTMVGGRNAAAVAAQPAKLIIDLPLERREVVLPFEFTDLPLPPS